MELQCENDLAKASKAITDEGWTLKKARRPNQMDNVGRLLTVIHRHYPSISTTLLEAILLQEQTLGKDAVLKVLDKCSYSDILGGMLTTVFTSSDISASIGKISRVVVENFKFC